MPSVSNFVVESLVVTGGGTGKTLAMVGCGNAIGAGRDNAGGAPTGGAEASDRLTSAGGVAATRGFYSFNSLSNKFGTVIKQLGLAFAVFS